VRGLPHDLHVRCGLQDHPQPRAHQLLVVDHENRDHGFSSTVRGVSAGVTGMAARTHHPPSDSGPATNVPPTRASRSRNPTRPYPPPGTGATPSTVAGPLTTVTVSSCLPWSTRMSTAAPGACRAALVNASCTTR